MKKKFVFVLFLLYVYVCTRALVCIFKSWKTKINLFMNEISEIGSLFGHTKDEKQKLIYFFIVK